MPNASKNKERLCQNSSSVLGTHPWVYQESFWLTCYSSTNLRTGSQTCLSYTKLAEQLLRLVISLGSEIILYHFALKVFEWRHMRLLKLNTPKTATCHHLKCIYGYIHIDLSMYSPISPWIELCQSKIIYDP